MQCTQLLHCAWPAFAVILSHLAWKSVEPFSQTSGKHRVQVKGEIIFFSMFEARVLTDDGFEARICYIAFDLTSARYFAQSGVKICRAVCTKD